MYSFDDRGGESVTLRPEGTAGVARAFISGGLSGSLPLKLFYRGPMFRYERPQKGRRRQFNQVGVELLGVAGAQADAEVIALGHHLLDGLGVGDKVQLELNSLGDGESRTAYRARLVEYLSDHRDELSGDSQRRLAENPLRIFDSKAENDRAIMAEAPLLSENLNQASSEFFEKLRAGLDALGVDYEINPRLVRGMDYYCHTAFEFTTDALGAQGAVLAGGRYDGLISQMGGPQTPGTGWAAGVERLAMLIGDAPPADRPLVVIPVGAEAVEIAFSLTGRLRHKGFCVDLGYSGNLSKRMKRANKINARAAVIVGEDELARNACTVRDMDTGDQSEVGLDDLETNLGRFR
ncbi:MAG: histidine--tRNA ligase, partial [Rhodospirillales bacterium]|nr:histidine--tRNA ligase [Rhodospirillales bacterium]